MDLQPLDGPLLRPVLLQDADPLELVVLGGEILVAAHAQLDGRHAGHARPVRPRVAVETLHLEGARVVCVAEGDGLLGTGRRLVPGGVVGATGLEGRKRAIELRRDLDGEMGILRLTGLELLRLTNTVCPQHLVARGRLFTEHQAESQHESQGDAEEGA